MPCPSGAPPPCRAARTTAAAAFILAVWQLRWKGWIRGAGLLAVWLCRGSTHSHQCHYHQLAATTCSCNLQSFNRATSTNSPSSGFMRMALNSFGMLTRIAHAHKDQKPTTVSVEVVTAVDGAHAPDRRWWGPRRRAASLSTAHISAFSSYLETLWCQS